jgi:hypothetical protein
MRAEVALGRCVAVGIDVQRVIGTGLRTGFASNAAAVVEIDDAVIAAEERACRADFDTRRGVAVIAAHYAEWRMVSGNSPFSMYLTQMRKTPTDTLCSSLQATVQA